jgi:hypothetical protein
MTARERLPGGKSLGAAVSEPTQSLQESSGLVQLIRDPLTSLPGFDCVTAVNTRTGTHSHQGGGVEEHTPGGLAPPKALTPPNSASKPPNPASASTLRNPASSKPHQNQRPRRRRTRHQIHGGSIAPNIGRPTGSTWPRGLASSNSNNSGTWASKQLGNQKVLVPVRLTSTVSLPPKR